VQMLANKITANSLTQQALTVLKLNGWHVYRNNNAGVYDPTKKVFRANSTTKGISDIIGFNKQDARFIAVEVKVGRDKLSIEQKQFLEDVNKAGGVGIECRSIDDIINIK